MHRKTLWRSKGEWYQVTQTMHRPLWWNPSWLRDAHTCMGGSWGIPNMDCEPDKSKWAVEGKPEEIPHISDLNYHSGVTLSLPHVSVHTVLIFPLNKPFACFTTFSLCGNSFLQSQRARALSLITDPWLGFHALTAMTQPQSQEPKSSLKMMQARATQDHELYSCMCAQSCLTLWDPMDHSPPGSSVHGIFQARILEWVATFYSRGSYGPRNQSCFSCVSCIGRWLLFHCATRKAPELHYLTSYLNKLPPHLQPCGSSST